MNRGGAQGGSPALPVISSTVTAIPVGEGRTTARVRYPAALAQDARHQLQSSVHRHRIPSWSGKPKF